MNQLERWKEGSRKKFLQTNVTSSFLAHHSLRASKSLWCWLQLVFCTRSPDLRYCRDRHWVEGSRGRWWLKQPPAHVPVTLQVPAGCLSSGGWPLTCLFPCTAMNEWQAGVPCSLHWLSAGTQLWCCLEPLCGLTLWPGPTPTLTTEF